MSSSPKHLLALSPAMYAGEPLQPPAAAASGADTAQENAAPERTGGPPPPADSGHFIFTRLKHRLAPAAVARAADAAAAEPAAGPVQQEMPAQQEMSVQSGEGKTEELWRAARAGRQRTPVPDWLPESQLEHAAPSAVALLTRLWGGAAAGRALHVLVLDGEGMVRRWPSWVWPELDMLCAVHAYRLAVRTGAPSTSVLASLPLLEKGYRHVVERLLRSWGNVEAFAVVCHDLFFDHRGGRTGWPAAVWEDLVLLQQIHERVHGRLPANAQPWNDFDLHSV
ncbi:hypothetical protein CKO31_12455 [Thiohalocapsa halophila]|uniref:Uncharacterized protein n=1 Tax=Thiohalocapsa halophila TaxID=69359 RepID=A0ABS1CI34_9GAMM|nr:hypothetical protein [Thiohalocapsa halophila]MBK1631540.1 hypothetical protein [Thiohalocapsa halophila]